MEAAHASWRPLGELIVERGLITQEQLEDALLEQRITRKRLGTILVEKGIVSAETLTNALVDQIGVDELLDEFDDDGARVADDGDKAPRRKSFRSSTQRLASPFARLRIRREEDSSPVVPFTPVDDDPDEWPEAYVPFSLVPEQVEEPTPEPESEATQDLSPEPEPEPAAEPEPEPVPAPKTEAARPQPEVEPSSPDEDEPHAWLADARNALKRAEADLARLDDALATRGYELLELRAELTEAETTASRANESRADADREVSRLKKALAEGAATEVALKRELEDVRARESIANSELGALRGELDRTKNEIHGAMQTLTSQAARIAEVEATVKDHELRGKRIAELEGLTAELSQRLAAASETLGVESNARDLAEQESQRLQAELQAALTERAQLQSKLESRERRLTKLDATVAELKAQVVAAPEPLVAPEPAPEPIVEPVAEPVAEARPEPSPAADPEPADAETTTGFLYFVPKAGEGYELVEHEGNAPAVGDTVELSGTTFSVTRHGRSPLPFDKRVCVYLRAA